jgi:hypothetical protein
MLSNLSPHLLAREDRDLPGGKGQQARKTDLIAICEPIVKKLWEPQSLTTPWASTAYYGNTFTLGNFIISSSSSCNGMFWLSSLLNFYSSQVASSYWLLFRGYS